MLVIRQGDFNAVSQALYLSCGSTSGSVLFAGSAQIRRIIASNQGANALFYHFGSVCNGSTFTDILKACSSAYAGDGGLLDEPAYNGKIAFYTATGSCAVSITLFR